MAGKETTLNFEIIRAPRVRAICQNAADVDKDWNTTPIRLRVTKEFLEQLNRTTLSILLRAMDNVCLEGRTTLRAEDLPTLASMGIDEPESLGAQTVSAEATG